MSNRNLKSTKTCSTSATDFSTSQTDLEHRSTSQLSHSASHKTSCIIVSPSPPTKHHTSRMVRGAKNHRQKNNSEMDESDCKLHGYQYSTLREIRRNASRSSRAADKQKQSALHQNGNSNLSKRSISSQTIYRQKPKKATYHCPHTDSSTPVSPKMGRIPPPPPPPRSLRSKANLENAENDANNIEELNDDELQVSDENEETTSEYDEDEIEHNGGCSHRSTPDIQQSSLHTNPKDHQCRNGVSVKENIHKMSHYNSSRYNYDVPRKITPPESCLTCVNPNHYHHYHHQVGNLIAPITLITASGAHGEPHKNYFFRQASAPYSHTNVKTALASTESHAAQHQHHCRCGVTFQPPIPKSIALNRTLSNPSIVTVPQPYREAPQLHGYNKSSHPFDFSSFAHAHEEPRTPDSSKSYVQLDSNIQDIVSDVEIDDRVEKSEIEVVDEKDEMTRKYELTKEAEHKRQINQITSTQYLHDRNSPTKVDGEMICPPPPPVPYGTLRYQSFGNLGNKLPNNIEKTTTPSSNVESSCGNSNSSGSSVFQAYHNDDNKQFTLGEPFRDNAKLNQAKTGITYNHVLNSKFSTPASNSSAWNGDVVLHESPTANSSSSSSYIHINTNQAIEGNNLDSGL